MKSSLNWISVAAAVVAAALWWISASSFMTVYVDDQTAPRADRMVYLKDGRQIDLIGTTEAQSRWSGYAAIVTGAAVFLQALGMVLRD